MDNQFERDQLHVRDLVVDSFVQYVHLVVRIMFEENLIGHNVLICWLYSYQLMMLVLVVVVVAGAAAVVVIVDNYLALDLASHQSVAVIVVPIVEDYLPSIVVDVVAVVVEVWLQFEVVVYWSN